MFKSHLRRPVRHGSNAGLNANSSTHADIPTRSGRCVALIDGRFLGWLLQSSGQFASQLNPKASRGLFGLLDASLRQAGLEVDILRAYWYADTSPVSPGHDILHRVVLSPDSDGGVMLLRSMVADLQALAQNRAVEHVLLVSDDDRLLNAVDDAQLCGLSVHMLLDQASSDLVRLAQDDPCWVRLLKQADRRVVMPSDNPTPRTDGLNEGVPEASLDTSGSVEAAILLQLNAWWTDEPEDQRLDLQDELKHSRSIPQEVDRQLLLRLSRALGHPLTWPEKKIMRDGVRRLVLGEDYTPFSAQSPELAAS